MAKPPQKSDEEINKNNFAEVCDLLQAGHRKSEQDQPIDTLNRLFKKNISADVALRDNAPILSNANTKVSMERWPKPTIRDLAPRQTSRTPVRLDLPVVSYNIEVGPDLSMAEAARIIGIRTMKATSIQSMCWW